MIFNPFQKTIFLMIILSAFVCANAQNSRKEGVSTIFNDFETNLPIEPAISIPLEYKQTDLSLADALPNTDFPGSLRPYSNTSLNSRSPVRLGSQNAALKWSILWEAPLDPQEPATFIHAARDRIIVQSLKTWLLFDDEGFELSRGLHENGNIVLDPANTAFYLTDPDGFMATRNLTDGSLSFLLEVLFGQGFQRTVLSRSKETLLIHSFELPKMPLVSEPIRAPSFTLLELQNLGVNQEIDEYQFLTSSEMEKGLISNTLPLIIAFNKMNNYSIAATTGSIYHLDSKLEIISEFTGTFVPQSLSLDEAGYIYMTLEHEDKRKLWRIKDGVIESETELPYSFNTSYPPIISYQHQILLIGKDIVLAIDPQKGVVWQWKSASTIAGALVTADGHFLVTTGSQIISLSPEGEPNLLAQLPENPLLTPPVLTSEGKLLVASGQTLFCLEAF